MSFGWQFAQSAMTRKVSDDASLRGDRQSVGGDRRGCCLWRGRGECRIADAGTQALHQDQADYRTPRASSLIHGLRLCHLLGPAGLLFCDRGSRRVQSVLRPCRRHVRLLPRSGRFRICVSRMERQRRIERKLRGQSYAGLSEDVRCDH